MDNNYINQSIKDSAVANKEINIMSPMSKVKRYTSNQDPYTSKVSHHQSSSKPQMAGDNQNLDSVNESSISQDKVGAKDVGSLPSIYEKSNK